MLPIISSIFLKSKNIKSSNSVLDYFLVILFFIFLILISNSKLTGEDDLFWYLTTGRYILSTGLFPTYDVFGFTTFGQLWIPFEWGWDIINYLIFQFSGFSGLSIFATLIILLFYFILYSTLKKFEVGITTIIFSLLVLTFGIVLRLSIKPHLFSYLLLTLLVYIILRFRYFERDNIKLLYLIPLVFLLWINMHMGLISGFLFLGIFIISELINFIFKNKRTLSKNNLLLLFLIGILSLLITLINPHGLQTYLSAFKTVSLKHLSSIYEWQSPFSEIYRTQFFIFIYYFFIIGIIPVSYYSYKNKDIFPFLVYSIYIFYSIRAERFTTDFMIVDLVFLTLSLNYSFTNIFQKYRLSIDKKEISIKVILICLMFFLIVNIPTNKIYSFLGYNRLFGSGIDNKNFPIKMFEFMKENKIADIGQRPFNSFETGGYFSWNFPGKMNFIGSRGINDEVWYDYVSIINVDKNFEIKIDSFGIDYVTWSVPLVNYSYTPQLLNIGIISYFFQKTEQWKLIYWNDNSLLFVKNVPKFQDLINKYSYNIITPYDYYFRRDFIRQKIKNYKEQVKLEVERKLNEDPQGRIINAMKLSFEEELK